MFIDQLTNADALPALEKMLQFSARRAKLIQHNIANIATPNFQPKDVDVTAFQAQLDDAIQRRRDRFGGHRGDLDLRESRQVREDRNGTIRLSPEDSGRNVMFHDRNNRDLERLMQDMVENATTFRVASDLLRNHMNLLRSAIAERV